MPLSNVAAEPDTTITFNNPRAISKLLVQFFVLWVGAAIAHHSLSRARHMSAKASARSLALFWCLPTFPAASFICRTVLCIYIACRKPWPSDRYGYMIYLASAALGLKTWSGGNDVKPFEGGANSVGLLDGEFEDYIRLQCSCNKFICSRWSRRLFGELAVLGLVVYGCGATLFLFVQRCSMSWQYMAQQLLTGTPPGQHDSQLTERGLDTVSGMDELNAVFAIGGFVLSSSAMVLKLTGWTWQHKSLGTEKERNEDLHLKSIRHSCMDARFELPLAMLLYASIARNSWVRLLGPMDMVPPGIVAIMAFILTLMGFNFLFNYVLWTTGLKLGDHKVKSNSMFLWGIILVSEWVLIHAWEDIFDMRSCLAGGQCPRPLFMWKNPWSDKLWTY